MNQGDKILVLLRNKGINYAQLAEISQVSARTVHRAINNQGINVKSLEKIAEALGVEMASLEDDNTPIGNTEATLRDLIETQKKYIAVLEEKLKDKSK